MYTYDEANRLTSVDGVAYSWDANGNLLSDGSSTYTYDHANRLSSVVQGPNTYVFAYNGLGDRLQQTQNGIPTTYTLDLEAGLTQVLSDGGSPFIYGMGRIAQASPGSRAYFLGDALSSARQLVDDAGRVGLGRAYEPYGDLLSIAGEMQTAYGFAGEWRDATGLVNLRARYYAPSIGLLTAKDSWSGDMSDPASFGKWVYARNNPATLSDPSGDCYGPLEFLRKVPIENGICTALDEAIFIYVWPGSSTSQRNFAAAYIGGWVFAHSGLIVGVSALTLKGGEAVLAWIVRLAIASPAATLVNTACQEIKSAWQTLVPSSETNLWPAPSYGRQIINGIEYTVHALVRMAPVGLGGRGIPPSVVENAIRFGEVFPGNDPGTLKHVYEQVVVVTDALSKVVITLWKTGG